MTELLNFFRGFLPLSPPPARASRMSSKSSWKVSGCSRREAQVLFENWRNAGSGQIFCQARQIERMWSTDAYHKWLLF